MNLSRISVIILTGLFALSGDSISTVRAKNNDEITIKRRIEPNYPNWAYTHGIGQGYAKIAFYVDEYGEASEFLAIEYSHEAFADELLKAVLKWKFVPAFRNGEPIKSVCHAYWEFLPDRAIVTNAFYDTNKRIDHSNSASFRSLRYRVEGELDNKLRMLSFPPIVAPSGYETSDPKENKMTVKCSFFVGMDGNVLLPSISNTTDPELDEIVLESLGTSVFERPVVDGESVIAWLEKTYAVPVIILGDK